MSKLEIGCRGILTGQIFHAAKHIETRRFYRLKAMNYKAFILTFILTFGFLKIRKREKPLVSLAQIEIGAGEGNRTLISGLGSPHSTTEPHPPPFRPGRTPARQARDLCQCGLPCPCAFTRTDGGWQQALRCVTLRREGG